MPSDVVESLLEELHLALVDLSRVKEELTILGDDIRQARAECMESKRLARAASADRSEHLQTLATNDQAILNSMYEIQAINKREKREMQSRVNCLRKQIAMTQAPEPKIQRDAERIDELLPPLSTLDADEFHLPLVDRDEPLLSLVEIHSQNRSKRSGISGAGGDDVVPLMDASFGSGKTTFG